MHHGPAVKTEKDAAYEAKQKIGLILFGIYCAIYAGFVIINTLSPVTMEIIVFLGLNLAVVYGFGLIILAIIMGLAYNYICTQTENKMNAKTGEETKQETEEKSKNQTEDEAKETAEDSAQEEKKVETEKEDKKDEGDDK